MSRDMTDKSIYDKGYTDALDDIRDLIHTKMAQIDVDDSSRQSYFTGMTVALHGIIEETYSLDRKE